jgi:hypothetical protein
MTQAILVQEAAIKSLDGQNKQLTAQIQQLQAELQQVKAQTSAAAPSSGGFLSSIFGGSSRDPQPAPAQPVASSGGGWREPARPSFNTPPQNFGAAPQQGYAPQQQAPAAAGSGFLGGALKTAAGVAGGVMLAQGISSLFHHNQPTQEIVEVIKEEPAQVNDQGNNGWGDDQRLAGNDTNGNDQGGFADADYSDDSSSFFGGDDDSFV